MFVTYVTFETLLLSSKKKNGSRRQYRQISESTINRSLGTYYRSSFFFLSFHNREIRHNKSYGEKEINFHCENCAGQNKNKIMLHYLSWQCARGLNTIMVGFSQFSPLHALSQQQGPNIWISSIFISAFHANIGKHFPLNMIIRVSDQFKTLNFLIF